MRHVDTVNEEESSIIFEHVSNIFTRDWFFVAVLLGSRHQGYRFQLAFLFANMIASDFLN